MAPSRRFLAPVVVLTTCGVLVAPPSAQAQNQAAAALHVLARVAPLCSIIADTPAPGAETIPSVRVICGRSGLRALRVSIGSGDAETPTAGLAGRQMRAGAEVVFALPILLGAVANGSSLTSLPRVNEPALVVVTLHF